MDKYVRKLKEYCESNNPDPVPQRFYPTTEQLLAMDVKTHMKVKAVMDYYNNLCKRSVQ